MSRARIMASITVAVIVLSGVMWAVPPAQSEVSSMRSRLRLLNGISDSGIAVTTYDPAVHADFADLFSQPNLQPSAQYAVVLSNDSPHAIDGFVFRWAIPREDQDVNWITLRADRFDGATQGPLLDPGESLIATPAGYVRTSFLKTRHFFTSAKVDDTTLDRLNALPAIDVIPDSVILDNGRLIGVDDYKVESFMRGRYEAAQALQNAFLPVRGNPQATDSLLGRMLAAAPRSSYPRTAAVEYWKYRYARSLKSSPQSMAMLSKVEMPPSFTR